MNWSRIIWKALVWLAGVLSIVLLPAVYAMLVQIVLAHWFTIAIFVIVFVGFPLAAHIEHSKR